MLVALPLLPVGGIVLHAAPVVVFSIGGTAFVALVLLLVWLLASSSMPPAGSPPVGSRFRFTIRDLLCLTTVVFGMTVFILSGFRCEAAERASRPGPLPAASYRQFAWELEAGLVCVTIGGLIWILPASGCGRVAGSGTGVSPVQILPEAKSLLARPLAYRQSLSSGLPDRIRSRFTSADTGRLIAAR